MLHFTEKRSFGLCLAVGVALLCAGAQAAAPWAWGSNSYGQLGNGTTTGTDIPMLVSGLSNVLAVAGGGLHSLALRKDGTVWAWGDNSGGQLGDGTTTQRDTPVQVSGLSNVVALACGYTHSLALMNDGTVWAWGLNSRGELGDGTVTNRGTPVQVSGLSGVVALACGWFHSLAVKDDGTAWAWGWNNMGQLGEGYTREYLIPLQVVGPSNVIAVAGEVDHSLALIKDGTVWTWGGQPFYHPGEPPPTGGGPAQVSGLSNVVAVAGGYRHALALKSDGTVWAWGRNSNGQLGDGTNTDHDSPAQVSGLSNAVAVAGGGDHSLAVMNDGTLWAWGGNSVGELGDGTTTARNTPVQVSGLSNVVAIAGGVVHSLALTNATVRTPAFSQAGATYTSAQSVTISCATSNANIYYTTDGSTPTTASAVYSAAISLSTSGTFTIKAYAVKAGWNDSGVAIATYTILVGNSGGQGAPTPNLGAAAANPVGGVSAQVIFTDAGVVQLEVDLNGGVLPPGYTATTTFYDGSSHVLATVQGPQPVFMFTDPGIYLAVVTLADAQGNPVGETELALPISAAETGTAQGTTPPSSMTVSTVSLKGKLLFNASKADTVTFKRTIELPAGLDLSKLQTLSVSLGNVVDTANLDLKGKAKAGTMGRIKNVVVKYPRLKKPATTTGARQKATVSFTLSAPQLDLLGFDCTGVSKAGGVAGQSVQRTVGAALVLGGTAYRVDVPVTWKLSKKGDSGQVAGRK